MIGGNRRSACTATMCRNVVSSLMVACTFDATAGGLSDKPLHDASQLGIGLSTFVAQLGKQRILKPFPVSLTHFSGSVY